MLLVLAMTAPLAGAQDAREGLRFEVDVLPGTKRFIELAAYPAYVAVALQNNGLALSQSGRIFIEDGRTLRFRSAVVRFVKRDKEVFHYNASIDWSIGIAQSKFELPVTADFSHVEQGRITVTVFPPLAELLPQDFAERIRLKLKSLATPAVQQRMLDYFDDLAKSGGGALDLPAMFERILIQAYNLPVVAPGLSGVREPGDAEPLSDQALFIVSVLIWIVAPLAILGRRWWRGRRAQTTA
jgi:hypothetical protein